MAMIAESLGPFKEFMTRFGLDKSDNVFTIAASTKSRSRLVLFSYFFIHLTTVESPPGLTRRGDTVYCYKSFEVDTFSLNTGQSLCYSYGANLVWLEKRSELKWVYNNLLGWNTGFKRDSSEPTWLCLYAYNERSIKFQNFGTDNEMDLH